MANLMKKKLALLGIGALVVVGIIVGFIFMQNSKKEATVANDDVIEEQAMTMEPDEIGLKLTPNSENTEVTMEISDTSKFNSFEYEMSYNAQVDGEVVPRGAIGSGEVKATERSIKRDITIGTCSSGKCKYDKGVSEISFLIKLNLKDGKTAVVKKDLKF